jgi:hypothetical protein
MCSQPPRAIHNDWIVDELLTAIPLIAKETVEVGFHVATSHEFQLNVRVFGG